jgi:hypothetical protein
VTSGVASDGATELLDADEQLGAWAASGAMAVTGRPDADPLGPPAGLVPKLHAVADLLGSRGAELGATIEVDPLALLGERAAIAGLGRQGDRSCGGATRMIRCGGRWLAVTLARREDVELVPPWLETPASATDVWAAITAAATTGPAEELVERGLLVGLPIGLVPPAPAPRPDEPRVAMADDADVDADPDADLDPTDAHDQTVELPIDRVEVPGPARRVADLAGLTVVDLSSLWAGPLCGSLLAAAGATVIKVESASRPDGARRGATAFFDLLNAAKLSLSLDLRTGEGIVLLREVVTRADVVIEGSRPRALERFGIDPLRVLATGSPRVWASITGHGRTGAGRDRVAFGDDAAAAGGLVTWTPEGPLFCADAVADPTTGLVAATAILDALTTERRWLLDISMATVAAHLAGPPLPATTIASVDHVSAPRARPSRGRGPSLGEHTSGALARIGIAP